MGGGNLSYTNEELAKRINAGERELVPELWANVEAFIRMRAGQFLRAATLTQRLNDPAIDVEDLVQESYFGMLKAIEYFDENSGYAFLTYLKTTLLKSFYKASGLKRKKHPTKSLNEPIGSDGDEMELSEIVEDSKAQNGFYEVMARDWQAQTLITLLEALELLEKKEQLFLWQHYFEGSTMTGAAAAAGYDGSRQGASAAHSRIMWKLRHCSKTRELHELLLEIDCEADIGSLAYHSPAEIAAMADIQIGKRRERAWHKKTSSQ